jgi:N-acetylglucosamine-6-phosphate deacetylase
VTQAGAARGAGSPRVILSGGDVVLPDRMLGPGSVILEDGVIAEIAAGTRTGDSQAIVVDCTGRLIVPGFIDVHVHGLEGIDSLDGANAIARIAERLPKHGVTGFCPTSVACTPSVLHTMLAAVDEARSAATGARVLAAHLESNFINPDYRGAQPLECIRTPASVAAGDLFGAAEILGEIRSAGAAVGIMTIAPEIEGAIPLIEDLVSRGVAVSLGHSGATYDEALRGIEAGASQATHLFNRMTPLGHRAPGLAAAVLESSRIVVEVICDGVHVHPAMVRLAFGIKGATGIMAITDGTAGAGLPAGSRASLGGRPITVRDAAYLDDGTIAGSVLTMERAFGRLTRDIGVSPVDAARTCATTPAAALGLKRTGAIVEGFAGDVVVLDPAAGVVATYIAGEKAWTAGVEMDV